MKNSTRIFIFMLLTLVTSGLSAVTRHRAAQNADNCTSVPLRHSVTPRTQAVPFYSQDFSGAFPEPGRLLTIHRMVLFGPGQAQVLIQHHQGSIP